MNKVHKGLLKIFSGKYCVNCVHHVYRREEHGNIWWNHLCKAWPVREPFRIDPVTGEEEYPGKEAYPHCREINKGRCKHFERQEDERNHTP